MQKYANSGESLWQDSPKMCYVFDKKFLKLNAGSL